MLARACLCLLLLACTAAWSQVDTASSDTANGSADETQLRVPPPVSGQAYSSEFAGETQSNIMRGGLGFGTAYLSNVWGAGSTNPLSDVTYSIWPTIALDKTTSQLHLMFNYSPGFTFYQHTSAYNQATQNLGVNLQYRLSPNLTVNVQDAFQKTSNMFNQSNAFTAAPVSGSVPTQAAAVVTPVADQLSNVTAAQLTYQVSADSMVGLTGSFNRLYYPNPQEVSGLFNSHSTGGSAYYSTRFGERYYIGGTFQYQNIASYRVAAPGTLTQTETIFAFLTVYLKPALSLSVSGGPQHYRATQSPLPAAASWQPMIMASLGWQGERTTLAASYARVVTGGGGLNGAFNSNSANVSAVWQATRNWKVGVSSSYSVYNTLTPLFVQSNPGGHTISAAASAQRSLTDHLNVQFGYNWTHQIYAGIPAISTDPNLSRVFVSINYQFARPLQR
jgi:hypothetical protein